MYRRIQKKILKNRIVFYKVGKFVFYFLNVFLMEIKNVEVFELQIQIYVVELSDVMFNLIFIYEN